MPVLSDAICSGIRACALSGCVFAWDVYFGIGVCVSRLGFWCLLFEPSSHLWSHTERGSRFGDNKTDNDNSNNNHHHHNYRNNNAIQTIHIHGSVHNKNSLRRVVVTMLRQCEREKGSNNKTNNGLVVVVLPAKCVLETSHA